MTTDPKREAFEKWAKGRGYQRDELDRCTIGIVGPAYYNSNTEMAWQAYQAGIMSIQPTPIDTFTRNVYPVNQPPEGEGRAEMANERAAKKLADMGYRYQAGQWGYVGSEPARRKHLGTIIQRLAELTKLEYYPVRGQGEREFIDRDQVMAATQAIAKSAYALHASPADALTAPSAGHGEGWLPISEAPKDRTEVLAWREDCGVFIASYTQASAFPLTQKEIDELDEEALFCDDWFTQWPDARRLEGSEVPTHFMPLPQGPEVQP